ncbi:hypothetical protein R6Q59_035080 [Mikania micrantha]
MLSLAASEINLKLGKQIHAQALVTQDSLDILVGNALVDMYAKCDRFGEANLIFASLPHRCAVPWTAIISSYVQKGVYDEALQLFKQMREAYVFGDQATFASTLRASANMTSLSLGKQLHSSTQSTAESSRRTSVNSINDIPISVNTYTAEDRSQLNQRWSL